jgi:hypothetical protein
MPNGFHWIEEVRHARNAEVTEEVFRRVRQELAATGIRLLSSHPLESVGGLLADPELDEPGDDAGRDGRAPLDAAELEAALRDRREAA